MVPASVTLLFARERMITRMIKMSAQKFCIAICAIHLFCTFSAPAADKESKQAKPAAAGKPSYEMPQPATESLDLTLYQRIRDEGLSHSHIMEYASALMDEIGPR